MLVSSSVAECAGCGCGNKNHASVSPAPAKKQVTLPFQTVEISGSENASLQNSHNDTFAAATTGGRRPGYEMKPSAKYRKRQEMLRATHLPSGLSVESDPEMETSTVSVVTT
jgi:hypothetical protein